MYKIIKFDKNIDPFSKLNLLTLKSYTSNRNFFEADTDNIKVAFLYTRKDMDKFCGRKTRNG